MKQTFLEYLKENKVPVTVFLMYGVKLQGIIVGIEDESILLKRDGHTQQVYKHAISTVMPAGVVDFPLEED